MCKYVFTQRIIDIFGIACHRLALIRFENNLNVFGVIKKCTINLDVILPELETEV